MIFLCQSRQAPTFWPGQRQMGRTREPNVFHHQRLGKTKRQQRYRRQVAAIGGPIGSIYTTGFYTAGVVGSIGCLLALASRRRNGNLPDQKKTKTRPPSNRRTTH